MHCLLLDVCTVKNNVNTYCFEIENVRKWFINIL